MPQEWGFREEQGLTILQGHGGGRVGGVAEDRGLGKGLSRAYQPDDIFLAIRRALHQFDIAAAEEVETLRLPALPEDGGLAGKGLAHRQVRQGLQVRLRHPGEEIDAPQDLFLLPGFLFARVRHCVLLSPRALSRLSKPCLIIVNKSSRWAVKGREAADYC